jgi:hypothetical protein
MHNIRIFGISGSPTMSAITTGPVTPNPRGLLVIIG